MECVAAAATTLARIPLVEIIRVERRAATCTSTWRARRSGSGELFIAGEAGITIPLPVLAESVVQFSLVGVGEHLVRFVDLLEALLRVLVARVEIRVMLSCQLAIRRANLFLGRRPRHAEHLVIVLDLNAGHTRLWAYSPACGAICYL